MAPEKKSSNINIEGMPHTGNLEGDLQELPHTEGAPSVQEFQGLDTGELKQVIPAPETSGALMLGDSERDDFQRKLAAQREYHEQQSTKIVESHTRRNITIGAASLLVVGGAVAGVTALNNQPSNSSPNTQPSARVTAIPGETQAPATSKAAESPLATPTNLGPLETAKPVETGPSLDTLKTMSPEAFGQLTNKQKGPYLKFLLSETDKHIQYFLGPNGEMYKFNPLDVASKANTPEQIANQLWFQGQLAYAQPLNDVAGDFTLDKNAAKKALSAEYYDANNSLYQGQLKSINAGVTAQTFGSIWTDAAEVSPLINTKDDKGNMIQTKSISVTDNGKKLTIQVVYDKLEGETSIWKIYKVDTM